MKTLEIEKIGVQELIGDYASLAKTMSSLAWHDINSAPWQAEFPYIPCVQFQVAYTDQAILVHYSVQEEYVKGQYIRPNENVWEDSCVEFFISFDNRETYYNVEFNVLGVGLVGYGTSVKSDRNRLSAEEILQINAFSSVQTIDGKKSWQQILQIPFSVFKVNAEDLKGKQAHANFYKCGDALPNPHFIAWNDIDNPTPNFHLPQFFGEVSFK
ncbi:carbohydrate-binding family 9-like protein [Sphingobacterium sp. BN32]|uniref:carbohydrate-binding family 9-like protein n=1 Tax=Sphingobacterium sp. BN32 TaxID=3058432 RepID=UPI00265CDB82|nr:carbohydrate-binding family 9-like protein [Sphingobacterium sp. BN32]WKK60076.1 carbohydrate-binding family 9-like protein [Sphingobacterium sp. BN32]